MTSEYDLEENFEFEPFDEDDFNDLSVEDAGIVTLVCIADSSSYEFCKDKLIEDSEYFNKMFAVNPSAPNRVEIADEDPTNFAKFASHLQSMPDKKAAYEESTRRLCRMSDDQVIENLKHYQHMFILADRYEVEGLRDLYKMYVFSTISHVVWKAEKGGEDAEALQQWILTNHYKPVCDAYAGDYPGQFEASLVNLLTDVMNAFYRVGILLNEIQADRRLTGFLFRIMLRSLIRRDEDLNRARAAGFDV